MVPNTELRTHCIAVRQHPHEIREVTLPPPAAQEWRRRQRGRGWTVIEMETRRVHIE